MVIRERSRKACPSPLSIRHTPSLSDALITSAGDRIVVPPLVAKQLEQLRRQHGVRSLRPLPCSTRSSIRSGIDVADLEWGVNEVRVGRPEIASKSVERFGADEYARRRVQHAV